MSEHLDLVDDSEKLKENLQLILKVRDAVSFKEFFGKLKNTTEKDIALALIYQATVEQILIEMKEHTHAELVGFISTAPPSGALVVSQFQDPIQSHPVPSRI